MEIWKFPFPLGDAVTVRIPAGARLLSAQVQNGTPCVWALVQPDAGLVDRTLYIRGTGHSASGMAVLPFVDTFQLRGGDLVFHVFDGGEVE